MEYANGNICIHVVSPDRPSKSSVAIGEQMGGRCGQHGSDDGGARVNDMRSEHRHQEPLDSTTRRNSSIGLSIMAEETNDISTYHLQQQQGYPFCAAMYTGPTVERRDHQCALRSNAEDDVRIPPYRPLVGSGAAAAYEALRHDFYVQKTKTQRRMSSLSFGSAKFSDLDDAKFNDVDDAIVVAPKNVAPPRSHGDEQFEMLKLHYFNLVSEIQETAMMLNICEQHQLMLRQEQQQAGQHGGQHHYPPGGPEPCMSRAKRPVPTDGSFEVSIPTKIVKL